MNINEFAAELRGGGARPNLYRVELTFPIIAGGNAESRKFSFLCKGAALPGSTIGVIEVPFRGRQLKVPGDRQYPEMSFTVINDENFVLRNAFERWMNAANAHTENKGVPFSELLTDIDIYQIDRTGKDVKAYRLIGCFPTECAQIDLAYDSNDQVEEFTVSMQMQYWISNTTS